MIAGMFLEVRIKLSTPFLGAQQSRERIRKFIRSSEKHIKLNAAQWIKAFHQAAAELRISNLDFAAIRLPAELYAPTIIGYNRKFFDRNGQPKEEQFEAIQAGAELSFRIVILAKSESAKDHEHAPTFQELAQMLAFIGEWIGLSPFGGQFNYGRFSLLSVTPI